MLLVRLSDPAYQTDLMVFLRNTGVEGVTRSGSDVQIADWDEGTLAPIIETWQSLHPGVTAQIVREER
jgi:hypothetical protein